MGIIANIDPLWFFPFFVAMWVGIGTLLSRIGGWSTLAERYRAVEPPGGIRFHFVSGSMGVRFFPVNYGSCLFVAVEDRGFYLSILFPFRFLTPPLFVPWSALESVESKQSLFSRYAVIRVRDGWPIISIRGRAGQCVGETFSGWQLAQGAHAAGAFSSPRPALIAWPFTIPGYGQVPRSELENPRAATGRSMEWLSNFAAVLFNAGFSLLAIVTLCGIVFITRPKQVMHDIQPWMWLPLLIVMAPAQLYSQYLAWRTIFAGQAPSGPAVARRQRPIPMLLKPTVALVWLLNFFIGFAIVVSLAKPHPGPPPPTGAVILVIIIGFWLAFAANVYLLLAVRTLTDSPDPLERIWRNRLWLDLAMAVVGALYYRL